MFTVQHTDAKTLAYITAYKDIHVYSKPYRDTILGYLYYCLHGCLSVYVYSTISHLCTYITAYIYDYLYMPTV
jgi:hypothetical protein